jgi:hypothetical protein
MMTPWEKFERVILLLAVIVLALDLIYWRPFDYYQQPLF